MQPVLFIVISILAAALIGGLTNYLAIKMLFHPRVPWVMAGRRVPFTPGLIPKRKEEIAESLGRVVSEYLVTSSSMAQLLRNEQFRESVRDKLAVTLAGLAEREETIEKLCLRLWPEERWAEVKSTLVAALETISRRGFDWLWHDQGWSMRTLSTLMPDWTEERREQLVRKGVQYMVDAIRQELVSPNGDRLIRSMTVQLMEQAGGFLGALAGIFMDESKVTVKVRQAIWEALDSIAVRRALNEFMMLQVRRAEAMTLGEIAGFVAGSSEQTDIREWLIQRLRWEQWTERMLSIRIDELLGKHLEWLEQRLPTVVRFAMNVAENNMERVFRAIRLEQLVESEVRQFPIERLEQIILSVSGREFRAITWLGALLGGMIGLMQALLLRWMT